MPIRVHSGALRLCRGADGRVAEQPEACEMSVKRAAKQEKLQPKETCFFLTPPFIELIVHLDASRKSKGKTNSRCVTAI
jgi:hypothetical protein